MIRFETVEDFERVDKALSNQDSKLSEYCIYDYGFCSFCESLSVCFPIKEPNHIRCNGCGNDFYPDQNGLSYLFYLDGTTRVFDFKFGDDIPEQPRIGKTGVFLEKTKETYLISHSSLALQILREGRGHFQVRYDGLLS